MTRQATNTLPFYSCTKQENFNQMKPSLKKTHLQDELTQLSKSSLMPLAFQETRWKDHVLCRKCNKQTLCQHKKVSCLVSVCLAQSLGGDSQPQDREQRVDLGKIGEWLREVYLEFKGKGFSVTFHAGAEGEVDVQWRQNGVGGERHALVGLPPGKKNLLLFQDAGQVPGTFVRIWRRENPLVFEPRTFHPITSHCTDYAIASAGEFKCS